LKVKDCFKYNDEYGLASDSLTQRPNDSNKSQILKTQFWR